MLFELALLLLAAKLAGFIATKGKQSSVLGIILIGIILGPGVLGIVSESEFLKEVSTIGVLLLMFMAGLETDMELLKKTKIASLLVGILGILLPLSIGYGLGISFEFSKTSSFFIGLLLSATSVSVSVQVLKELGKLNTTIGAVILGAAVIDDLLVILTLTFFLSFTGDEVNILSIITKKILFFGIIGIVSWKIIPYLFDYLYKKFGQQSLLSVSFIFCLLVSYFAEKMGVAGIIGAFIAGLTLSFRSFRDSLIHKTELFSNAIFVPIFFISVGFYVSFEGIADNFIFISILSIAAILTKWIGSYFGGRLAGLSSSESNAIGIGMVSRGEVALILLAIGMEQALIPVNYYSSFVIIVIITTIFTPILLRLTLNKKSLFPKENSISLD